MLTNLILLGIVFGLGYAHGRGLIQYQINKPENDDIRT